MQLELDQDGHLVDYTIWNHEVAQQLALSLDLELTDWHFEVLHAVRQFYQPPEQFCQTLELLFQLEHTHQLQAPLGYLLQLLQLYLQQRDQHCYQLHLKLELRDHPPLQLSLQSARGEYLQTRWLVLFQLKLQQLKLPAPLLKMQLWATQTTARDGDNLRLFASHAQQGVTTTGAKLKADEESTTVVSSTEVLGLRSLLAAKLGDERVQQPVWFEDHRPEFANRFHTLELTSVTNEAPPAVAGAGTRRRGLVCAGHCGIRA